MDALPLRYVVLRHEGVPEPHYDVMWETSPGSALTTVRAANWPAADNAPLERLPDHRRVYLDYEGPVSGNRGHVRRIASGTCRVETTEEGTTIVRFDTGPTLTLRV